MCVCVCVCVLMTTPTQLPICALHQNTAVTSTWKHSFDSSRSNSGKSKQPTDFLQKVPISIVTVQTATDRNSSRDYTQGPNTTDPAFYMKLRQKFQWKNPRTLAAARAKKIHTADILSTQRREKLLLAIPRNSAAPQAKASAKDP